MTLTLPVLTWLDGFHTEKFHLVSLLAECPP